MKAVQYAKYGSREVIEFVEMEKPHPKANEVLIHVKATTISPSDMAFRKGDPFIIRLFDGLLKPKSIPGDVFGGDVVSVGTDVTRFKFGDRVYGTTAPANGTHAEYVSIAEDKAIAPIPNGMTYGEAASLADGAITAIPFLRDKGKLERGQHILINGASGSVGLFAVQLAKTMGAVVTGVCSTAHIEVVERLGADQVIDYTQEDFTKNHHTYDLIFDAVGKSSYTKCKKALTTGGTYMTTVPTMSFLFDKVSGGKKAIFAATGLRKPADKRADFEWFHELVENGELQSVIDRAYPFHEMQQAHQYVEGGHKTGNVVVRISENGKE